MSTARIRSVSARGGTIFYDAVLNNDMKPIFNGTPEQTSEWLKVNPGAHDFSVCIGETMKLVSVQKYLESR